jgi:hypothetical protein
MISAEQSRKVTAILYHGLATGIILGGMSIVTAAACQSLPQPTGVSVQTAPGGGTETCVTWASQNGCVCQLDAGPGK